MNLASSIAHTEPYQLACLLGRQPELSMAELEQYFGTQSLSRFSDDVAVASTDREFDVQTLGGVVKAGRVIAEIDATDWLNVSKQLVRHYQARLKGFDGKITLGISVYGRNVSPRDIQKTGLTLKQTLKKQGNSVRLIPNDAAALSTATSHHNKLGLSDNKREICVFYGKHSILIAESVGTQNITALAARDQGRPKRDAFVGMLPPKLALMMVNMSSITKLSHLADVSPEPSSGMQPEKLVSRRQVRSGEIVGQNGKLSVLDPFCGTGVVLQEAALLGFNVYGSDLSEKMVDYSQVNLGWLLQKYHLHTNVTLEHGDAVQHTWQQPIDAVVTETYLGQPFSAPPAPDKLKKVVGICNDIIAKFLTNLATQLEPGTPLCVAVSAWRDTNGDFTHLPLITKLESLGYAWQSLGHVDVKKLAYYREEQVVARQLLLLERA